MQSFLSALAEELLSLYPKRLHDVLILLPGKRGEVFLKQELSRQSGVPYMAPMMLTIEEFVQRASGYQKLSQLQLLIKLFEVYNRHKGNTETFDNFLKWGTTLLQDFNEIDRHMVEASSLFGNLLDIKKIESWQPDGQPTELMANFLSFWNDLLPVYEAFKNALDEENCSYQGMAFRKVAEQTELLQAQLGTRYCGIVLAGFNALNKAEERIFSFLKQEYNAQLFWDADEFYLNNSIHEAGQFLREHRKNGVTDGFRWSNNFILNHKKNIHIASAPGQQGIAQLAGYFLEEQAQHCPEETALVLADEALLLPMLDSLPDAYTEVNITMGLPLQYTHVARDVQTYLRLLEQAERLSASRKGYTYHHRFFVAVSECPTFKKLLGYRACNLIQQRVTNDNLVFMNEATARDVWQQVGVADEWLALLTKPQSAMELTERLLKLVKSCADIPNDIHKQAAYGLHRLFNQLMEALKTLPDNISMSTYSRLYSSLLRDFQIDFYGEPLAGLQIMGMLETRTLDFKRVIITSVNEGVLPSGKTQNSFIPYDLKVAFGMPTHHEKDAVYAYHFYRLLQRTEEIWLIYDSSMSGLGSKEKSRFIAQIETEWAHLPNVTIWPVWHFTPDISSESLLKNAAHTKDDFAMHRLQSIAERGISASALTSFINSPPEFYEQRMLKVQEPDEVNEIIGYDVLGNVVHEALQNLYTPVLNQILTHENINHALKQSDEVTLQELKKLYRGNIDEGKNLIIKKVAQHMVRKVLEVDAKEAQTKPGRVITMLEGDLACECTLPASGRKVRFIGKADRIEATENEVFVIDYKTGYVKNDELSAKDIQHLFEPSKKNKAFQVMFYAWLYRKCFPNDNREIAVGLFSTRAPSQGFMRLKFKNQAGLHAELFMEFENRLIELVEELFDASLLFEPRGLTLGYDNES